MQIIENNRTQYAILKKVVKALKYEGKGLEERRKIVENYYNMKEGVFGPCAYLGAALGVLPAIMGVHAIQTIENFPLDRNGSLETLLIGVGLTLPLVLSVGKMVHNEVIKARFCEPFKRMDFADSS